MESEGRTNDCRSGNFQEKDKLTFYLYDDLAAQDCGATPTICRFDSLEQALGAYRYVSAKEPHWPAALGGSLGRGSLDFLQRREGKDVLIGDWKLMNSWAENPDVQKAVAKIASELGFEDQSLDKLKEQAKERAAAKNESKTQVAKAKNPELER